ncbi:MAG: hypothetical protein WD825_05965 [Gemmatimonadaceae bacterium]
MRVRLWMVAFGLTVAFAVPAHGQRRVPPANSQVPSDRVRDSVGRARLEGEIRRGFARAVRQRVGLSQEQMGRLVPLTQRYEQDRRRLQIEERDARTSLRRILRNESSADAKEVDRHLQTLVDVQKRRAQLLESEQRELATIMTPVQRAKFMAMQEQIRRRLEQMRQRPPR